VPTWRDAALWYLSAGAMSRGSTPEHRGPLSTRSGPESGESGGTARVRQLHLLFAPSSAPPTFVTLGARALAIGREPDSSDATPVIVPDDGVSRTHAVVEYDTQGDSYSIIDRNSRNGTIVNGSRVECSVLERGSVIRIGGSLLVFVDVELRADGALEPETDELRGQSLVMQQLRGDLALVARRGDAVLLLGESGVGKECAARAIHRASGRSGAFVPVNCAAIPEALAESEFFGHAAGAFTGATQRAAGLFASAHEGTLFLDEIGDLPASIQPKLLRALDGGEVRPVGSSDARRVDVRIVAATHRDAAGQVADGVFRGDLFARLSAWTVHVPPLRNRREDVLRLARRVLERESGARALSSGAAEALLLYDWPFNVRQLEHVVATAAARAERSGVVRCAHLPDDVGRPVIARGRPLRPGGAPAPLEALVRRDGEPSEGDLRLVLERLDGSMAQAAAFFGKDRRQIYRWVERHGIDVTLYRGEDSEE
jgi:DNA-binding NtrC family response regulator